MEWNTPLRVAIHEIGHIVVEYRLRGIARDCYCYTNADGSQGGETSELADSESKEPQSRQDRVDLAAEFLGGWAAVNLAIGAEILPAAPASVEATPGDFGYLGSDHDWVVTLTTQAEPANPALAEGEARKLALDLLRPQMTAVVELAKFCAGAGYVTAEMVMEQIER